MQVHKTTPRHFSLLETTGDFPGMLESSWAVVRSTAVCPFPPHPILVFLSAGSCSCVDVHLFLVGPKKKRCICFCYNKEWWRAEISRFCRLGSRSAAENLLGLLHTWNKEPEKGKGESSIKRVNTLILLIL